MSRIRELIEQAEREQYDPTQWTTEGINGLIRYVYENAEALADLVEAAKGLSHGEDWNNGTHAKTHGYRKKLIAALQRLGE